MPRGAVVTQVTLFQKMAEVENQNLNRNRIGQSQASEAAHVPGAVKLAFNRPIS